MHPNEYNAERQLEPLCVSVSTASHLLGLSRVTIYRLIAAEKLRSVKAGVKTLVETVSIRDYLASLPRFVGKTGKRAA